MDSENDLDSVQCVARVGGLVPNLPLGGVLQLFILRCVSTSFVLLGNFRVLAACLFWAWAWARLSAELLAGVSSWLGCKAAPAALESGVE